MKKLEEEERTRIEKTKQEERQKATEEIEKFKLKSLENIKPEKMPQETSDNPSESVTIQNTQMPVKESKAIFEMPSVVDKKKGKQRIFELFYLPPVLFNFLWVFCWKVEEKILPEPRSSGKIQISFTPRVFPTPSRESQDKNEKEWLKKQAEARQASLLPEELKDLSENEQNLEWLKEKAK